MNNKDFEKKAFSTPGNSFYNANVFLRKGEKDIVMTGIVVDEKYFIDARTEEVYDLAEFYLVNNLDAEGDC